MFLQNLKVCHPWHISLCRQGRLAQSDALGRPSLELNAEEVKARADSPDYVKRARQCTCGVNSNHHTHQSAESKVVCRCPTFWRADLGAGPWHTHQDIRSSDQVGLVELTSRVQIRDPLIQRRAQFHWRKSNNLRIAHSLYHDTGPKKIDRMPLTYLKFLLARCNSCSG